MNWTLIGRQKYYLPLDGQRVWSDVEGADALRVDVRNFGRGEACPFCHPTGPTDTDGILGQYPEGVVTPWR